MKTATIKTVIPPDHCLVVQVPEDVPSGPAEVTVRPVETTPAAAGTAADLLASGLFGIWKNRSDIDDTSGFARQLRRQAEQRGDG